MKKNLIILLSVIALVVVVLLSLSHRREKAKLNLPEENSSTNAPVMGNSVQPSANTQQVVANASASAPLSQATVQAIDSVALDEKARAIIEAKNVPLDFYARVIDQDSNSLPSVNIKLAVRHWDVKSIGSVHIEKTTDANGRFEIHGLTGDGFDVENIGKEGYESEPSQRSFAAAGGSFDDPVTFKMWKTNLHEQLITGEKSFRITPDGKTYFINLTDGTIAESGEGDLKVWVKRPEQVANGKKYDWSCEVDVINGGLFQEADANSPMYYAPSDDYAPSFQFEQKVGSGWGDSTGSRRFYLKLKNGGEYGRVKIEMFAYYNDRIPGLVRIEYALNPSGSRVLH